MKQILFFVTSLFTFNLVAQDCSDLFISEYAEGNSQNKAIEIYNPTSQAIDLNGYRIERYSNGSSIVSEYLDLSGTIGAYDVWVVTNGETDTTDEYGYCYPELYNMADQVAPEYPSPLHFNGDDAMGLTKNGVLIDLFGKKGEDPGDAWTDDVTAGFTDVNGGTFWTRDQTLVRKASVKSGVTSNPVLFDPTAEWDSLPRNTWTELGEHECDCSSGSTSIQENEESTFIIYPNPSKSGQVLTLNANKGIKELFVINVLGQPMKVEISNSGKNTFINTSNLSKGLYNISMVFDDYSVKTSAIIIK